MNSPQRVGYILLSDKMMSCGKDFHVGWATKAHGRGSVGAGGWIGVYEDPLLTAFDRANIGPHHKLYRCYVAGKTEHSYGLEYFVTKVIPIEEVPIPSPTVDQLEAFAERCCVGTGVVFQIPQNRGTRTFYYVSNGAMIKDIAPQFGTFTHIVVSDRELPRERRRNAYNHISTGVYARWRNALKESKKWAGKEDSEVAWLIVQSQCDYLALAGQVMGQGKA